MDRIILVLEDSTERVDWLKGWAWQHGRIVWATGVRSFLKLAVLLRPRLGMVILDHDLGLTPGTNGQFDSWGFTGLDAARQFSFTEVPALVWSCNFTAAQAMQDALVANGVAVECIPFLCGFFDQIKDSIRKDLP